MLALIYGGSGSGKSAFGEALACQLDPGEKWYLATMQPWDEESRQRIARHRIQRAGKHFRTLEQFTDLHKVSLPGEGTVLLECLSNLLANEQFRPGGSAKTAKSAVLNGIAGLAKQSEHTIVISNQIFSDGIAYDFTTQEYLQALGELHQIIAAQADLVVEVVCGIPLIQKGALPE